MNFNDCDCDLHTDVVVYPFEKDNKKKKPAKVINGTCKNESICNKCFQKLSFINHVIYKVCVKPCEKFKTLPIVMDYFFTSDNKKYFCFDDPKKICFTYF